MGSWDWGARGGGRGAEGAEFCEEGVEGGCDGGGEEDEAGSGGAGELEADIPERERVGQGHGPASNGQADQRGAAPADGGGVDEEAAHERGAHDRGVAADQQGVGGDAQQGRVDAALAAKDARAEGDQHAGDQGHVGSRDDDHVAGAGQVELVVEVVGDARFDAQQHAVGQGGIGFGQELVEQGFAVGAQGVDALQDGAAQIGAIEHVDACIVHQAVDVLARQVLPVREILEIGRRHQPATQAHRLAVDVALADAGAQAQLALDRLLSWPVSMESTVTWMRCLVSATVG